jgi:hypothetical protein
MVSQAANHGNIHVFIRLRSVWQVDEWDRQTLEQLSLLLGI